MSTTSTFLRTYASIDLMALAHNVTQFQRALSPGCDVMAVVKANAYGHGAVETTKALIRQGISRVAVVSIEEGMALRKAGINAPIIVMGAIFPEQFSDLFAYQLTPAVGDSAMLSGLARTAASLPTPYSVHLKIETGMGRLGLTLDEVVGLIDSHRFPTSLQLEGLMTHLADVDGSAADATRQQLAEFNKVIALMRRSGFRIPLIHAANSGGAIRFPETHYSLVRPGLMLYGYHTLPKAVAAPDLKPILSLHTCIAQLRQIKAGSTVSYGRTFTAKRPMRIAILPIGYADGLSRRLSNRGHVLIRGQRAQIVGLVCMDMVMVDATEIDGVAVGDEAVLIGRQGDQQITANDIAEFTGTIPYEVLCTIGARIPRRYHPT